MKINFSFNYWLSLFVFVIHIIANLIVTKPTVELFSRLEKLTLFPPGWVFGIWFVIWTLQSILFYKTYGSEFWSNQITLLFILVCIGNLGSQYAGANNLGWFIYIRHYQS
jgi:tryptophan-rich sensory protein